MGQRCKGVGLFQSIKLLISQARWNQSMAEFMLELFMGTSASDAMRGVGETLAPAVDLGLDLAAGTYKSPLQFIHLVCNACIHVYYIICMYTLYNIYMYVH